MSIFWHLKPNFHMQLQATDVNKQDWKPENECVHFHF